MTTPKLKTSTGDLTAYAYACGYVDKHNWLSIDHSIGLSFEHGVYYIKGYRPYNIGDQDCPLGDSVAIYGGKHVSEAFPTLGKARKRFNELCRMPDILIN